MTEERKIKEITVALNKEEFVLGEPLPLAVTYKNVSGSSLQFEEPDKRRGVYIDAVSTYGESNRLRLMPVKVEELEDGATAYVAPEAKTISLAPGRTYDFSVDVVERFVSMFPPGEYRLKIIDKSDRNRPVESNEVTIRMRFVEESIPRLMSIVGGESRESSFRYWAASWLQKLKADFRPQFAAPGAPDSIRQGCREATRLELEKVRAWWATAQNSEATRATIRGINDAYFKVGEEKTDEEPEEEYEDENE